MLGPTGKTNIYNEGRQKVKVECLQNIDVFSDGCGVQDSVGGCRCRMGGCSACGWQAFDYRFAGQHLHRAKLLDGGHNGTSLPADCRETYPALRAGLRQTDDDCPRSERSVGDSLSSSLKSAASFARCRGIHVGYHDGCYDFHSFAGCNGIYD